MPGNMFGETRQVADVRDAHADILPGDVAALNGLNQLSEIPQQPLALRADGPLAAGQSNDGLGPTEREAGRGCLEAHRAGEALSVR
jgi:hypothetical protein